MFNEKNDPGSWRPDYAVASSGIGDTELKDRKDKKIKREGRGGAVRAQQVPCPGGQACPGRQCAL